MQLRDVSREMGMKPSALQSAIDRNLTVKTLRQISEAARIPIAEFFFDELKSDPKWVERIFDILTDTDRQQLLAALQPSAQPSQQPAEESAASTKGGGLYAKFYDEYQHYNAEDSLQGAATPPEKAVSKQAIICPHCGHALVMNIASYEQK